MYHLHLPPSRQEKCELDIQPHFTHLYLHYCSHYYQLHVPQFQQGECHLGIFLFSLIIFLKLSSVLSISFFSISTLEVLSNNTGSFSSLDFYSCHLFLSFTHFSFSVLEVSSDNSAPLVFLLSGYAILGSVPYLFLC